MVFIFNPLSELEHFQMATILKNEFNEVCYMSCSLLLHKSTFMQQFTEIFMLIQQKMFLDIFG